MNKKTLKDIDLKNKRVLLRADYNVPVKNGIITNDYRIKQSLPTARYILEQEGSSLIIISHLGRPGGKPDHASSLEPAATHLADLLGKPVRFVSDCVGEQVERAVQNLKAGGIMMLENLRFHAEEESNSSDFAKAIVDATGAQVFVQDGFGVVHRAHASTEAIAKALPSAAGLLLEKEVETIAKVMKEPEHPMVTVVGGAKISDKVEVLNRFIDLADCVAIGGAMANSFLAAAGLKVGKSLVEPEAYDTAREIMQKASQAERQRPFSFLVPVDVVVSKNMEGKAPARIVDLTNQAIADVTSYPKKPDPAAFEVKEDEMILDIGPVSSGYIAGAIRLSRTVMWNGAMGVTETKGIAGAHAPFSHGTRTIVDAMIGASRQHANRPFTFIGGGDTVGYVEEQGLVDEFGHVSTGGGASLELMGGKKLPGIEALQGK